MAFPKQYSIFRGPSKPVKKPVVLPSPLPELSVSVPETNVVFHAPWALWGNGICTVWRRMARALANTGAAVQLTLDYSYGDAHPESLAEVSDLVFRKVSPNVFVGGFPTSGDAGHAATIDRLNGQLSRVALTSMIERDRIGPLAVTAANRVRQWWLPNDANIEAFRSSGVDAHRLYKVHVPFFPDDPHLKLVGRTKEAGPTHFYQIGVFDKRKDQAKIILCFLSAFRPGEAVLTIKTTYMGVDLNRMWLEILADRAVKANGWNETAAKWSVHVICEVWSEEKLLDLHRRGDVYVTLSHGEGWEMSAYDALLSGNRMVYTASGGPQEFASEGDLLVPTTSTPICDPFYDWEPDARWVDYDRQDAVRQLRAAHERPLAKIHRRSWAGFTAADVGALMRRLLEELISEGDSATKVATTLMYKWMSGTDSSVARDLSHYTIRELLSAVREGPVSVEEAIHDGRTDLIVVYRPNQVPHGVASHVLNMKREHPNCSWVKTLGETLRISERSSVRSIVVELQWGNEALTSEAAAILTKLRSRGIRVVVDYHHAEKSTEWLKNLKTYTSVSDQVVFYHPEAVKTAGTGIYHPLPIPKLKIIPRLWVGGLTFAGFADPSRCIDKLVAVAQRLGERIYGYGPRVDRVSEWYNIKNWTQFRPMRSYLDENEGVSELARHSVALLARSPSSRAYSSASARFCMAAGIPIVVDGSKSYEDLRGHVGATVSYDDHRQVDGVVRRLLEDRGFRSEALERQRRYSEKFSVASLLTAMGIS